MLKKILLTISIFLCFLPMTQAQSNKWMKSGGGTETMTPSRNFEQVNNICTDDNGNVYVTAITGATDIVADTFYEGVTHHTGSSIPHILLASYDCNGTMRWAKMIESYNYADAGGLAYTNGSIYLVGRAAGWDKYIGYDTVIASSNMSSFTLRIDTSGQFKWIKFIGLDIPSTFVTAKDKGVIAIDGSGYIHNFSQITAGCQVTSSYTTPINGNYDLKYDSSGTLLSIDLIPELDSIWRISNAVYSKTNNKLYAAIGINDLYWWSYYTTTNYAVAAFNPDESLIWMDTTGPNGWVTRLDYGGSNELYVAGGGYSLPYSLGGMSASTPYGFDYGTIFKMDTSGLAQWVYNIPSVTNTNNLTSMVLTPNHKIAVHGYFGGKMKHGVDSIISTPGEVYNPLILIIDSGGHTIKLDQLHGPGSNDYGKAIACDANSNLFLGGCFSSTISATGLTPRTTNGGNTDFYIMKFGYDCGCTTIPLANFTSTGSSAVSFTYTGTAGYDSLRWYFGDGGTSTLGSPSHAYTASGTYHVCVTVYTGCGSDTHCADIVVTACTTPVANFTSTGTTTVSFTYTGTIGYDSVRWYFGDGGTSTLANPTHTFTASGTYTVCVTTYKPCGSNTHCSTYVVCIPPVANFTSSGTGAVSFNYTGTTGYDSVRWNFGDGGTSNLANPTHTFTANGTYTVCVTAYKTCGANTHCSTITVCMPPVPSFTSVGTFSVNFTYTGTMVYDSLRWKFGDGGTSTIANPSHLYSAPGTYHICVRVYNGCGSDSACANKTVSVGVAGLSSLVVKIYPNPGTDELIIENIPTSTFIRLLDMTGREVYNGVSTTNLYRVDMSRLPAATYLVRLTDIDGNAVNSTVIKQ